jgi:drug/metabolite transporter (DMT)-like permease
MAISMAFCHVAWLHLARRLPPAASGLSMMMIPVLGVFSSMWLLGERPRWQDYIALALIVFSLATVLLPARRKRESSRSGGPGEMQLESPLSRAQGGGDEGKTRG